MEFLSKAFFSCLLQDVLYAITSSIFIPFSFRIFARFDTVFNALTYRVFLSFKYGISSYAKSFPWPLNPIKAILAPNSFAISAVFGAIT